MQEIVLSCLAFCTSWITAVSGTGGGLILIGLMAGVVPPAALIPVHGVVQLASNVSRSIFSWKSIRWEYVASFLLGSLLGGSIATVFIQFINLDYMTLLVAAFILLSVWAPNWIKLFLTQRTEMFGIGLIQTGLGTVGAITGPLANASMMRLGLNHDQVVTTAAAQMSITHVMRITAFALLGVSLAEWFWLMLGMSAGVILGSWVGTRSRANLNQQWLLRFVKILLTFLALRMIVLSVDWTQFIA